MRKLKILVIEDEEKASTRLINLIKEVEPDCIVIMVLESVESAVKWFEKKEEVDLIFLDIQLSDGLCFNIFDKVEVSSPIIFTTAFDEFALKAFELNSIDYLLKPIDKEKLKQSIVKFRKISENYLNKGLNFDAQKLLEAIRSKDKNIRSRFLVNKGDKLVVINVEDIAYFYTEDKAVFIVTHSNKKYLINNTLDNLEEEIEQTRFFRLNRQFLASIESIKEIKNYFNYKFKIELEPKFDDVEVIISKSKTKDFKKWLSN